MNDRKFTIPEGGAAQWPCQVLTPAWPAPARVKAQFTLRQRLGDAPTDLQDGMSQFNLGTHVGDDAASVLARRASVDQALGCRAVYLNQVHGTAVQVLAPDAAHSVHPADAPTAHADASCTREADVACAIMVADCLPVLMCNRAGDWVGAAHAGWRGLAGQGGQGVLEALVQTYRQQGGQPDELMAWLGPCIGPTAFEVGAEVRDAFLHTKAHAALPGQPPNQPGLGAGAVLASAGADALARQFVPVAASGVLSAPGAPGKFMANLPGLARWRLQALGVADVHGNDGTPAWCTVSRPELFFSYRRDQARLGASGRMCVYIWLD